MKRRSPGIEAAKGRIFLGDRSLYGNAQKFVLGIRAESRQMAAALSDNDRNKVQKRQ